MPVDYNHSQNTHTLLGPQSALPIFFADSKPSSLLDVGCGTGTWLKAAMDLGVIDVLGVDGVKIPSDQLKIPVEKFRYQDLTKPWDLGRRFAAAICLEVGEHLEPASAPTLIDSLVKHSDLVFFSAALPGQTGQHHVNCQWPEFWQQLFNQRGFTCSDKIRWQIWDDTRIEAWYRQNIFMARRDAASAGHEPRIKGVVHWDMLEYIKPKGDPFENHVKQIEKGRMDMTWYLKMPLPAMFEKLKRSLS